MSLFVCLIANVNASIPTSEFYGVWKEVDGTKTLVINDKTINNKHYEIVKTADTYHGKALLLRLDGSKLLHDIAIVMTNQSRDIIFYTNRAEGANRVPYYKPKR